MIWGIFIAATVVVIYAIWLYNRLVHDRNTVLAAWSDIDVQLKRRHDLIPKLVEAVRQYADYEQATLTRVTELRKSSEQARSSASTPAETGRLEGRVKSALFEVLAVAEAYPELKTSEQFTGLQDDISEVEKAIQFARRYYNGAVKAYNVQIETFPGNLVAGSFRFRQAEYFEWE